LQIELLPAKEADAEELVILRIAAMRESLQRIGRFDPRRARERFLSGFSPKQTRHILQNGMRVGFVVVKPIEGEVYCWSIFISFRNTKAWVLGLGSFGRYSLRRTRMANVFEWVH
jgi:hypothetical protein